MPDELRDNLIALLVKQGHKGKDIVDEVRGILSLIDAQRCVWTRRSHYVVENDMYTTKCKHTVWTCLDLDSEPFCPCCGKRIEIVEVR